MPRVMRILNRLSIGGPLLNAAYLTRYMSPEFETLLVAGEKENHESDAGFITNQLGIKPEIIPEMGRSINPWKDYRAYDRLKQLIKKFRPDIVHTHAAKPGAVGRMAARKMNVPVIVHTYHGHVFHSYFNTVHNRIFIQTEKWLAKRTDAIIAISPQQFRELSGYFKIAPEAKFRIIPLGLDLEKFQQDTDNKRKKFRQEFGIGEDEVVITITGRLVPVKNHSLFLEAFAHVLKNTGRKVRAVIVGDGESRSQLEEKANRLDIAFSTEKMSQHPHPLIFTSWRNDIDIINAGSDIVALTSLNEGTPVSLIEAQAAGRPVVSTAAGGIGDIVVADETALLSEQGDSNTFFTNLLRLVEDDELRNKLGKNSASFVMSRFGYRRLVNDMTLLYHELLEKKGKHALQEKK